MTPHDVHSPGRHPGAASWFWAPGVRLFSRVPFVGKAVIISVVFLLVLAQSTALVVRHAQDISRSAERQLVGVQIERALLEGLEPALAWRRALTSGEAAPAEAHAQALERALADAEAHAAGKLDIGEVLRFVRQAAEPLKRAHADVDEAYAASDGLVQQMLRAMVATVDIGSLNRESDPLSSSLVSAVAQDLPELMAGVGRVADLGGHATATGEASAATRRIVQGETYQLFKRIETSFDRYEKLTKREPEFEKTLAFQAAFDPLNVFMRHSRRALPADDAGKSDGAPIRKAGLQATEGLKKLATASLDQLESRIHRRVAAERRAVLLQLGFVAACLLAAAYLFMCFYRVTRDGMSSLRHHLDQMAAGRLNTAPHAVGRDETAEVMRAVDAMQASLRQLVGHVRDSADQMVEYSEGLTRNADRLSERTSKVTQHMQASAGDMTGLATATRQSVAELQSTADCGRAASAHANDSLTQMQVLMSHIEELHGASQRVGEIVGVIDSIAFQTNILALNAAVEAARAGEQGRGFAVVAAEVRALAQRSAAAAREIKTLVSHSQACTDRGTTATRSAADSLRVLADAVLQMGRALDALSSTQARQMQQISSVAEAISEVDRESARNASLVDDTAHAAQDLRSRAHALKQSAEQFTT